MKLFHFTAKRFLEGIRKDGLTRGMMVKSMDPPQFIPNMQWLTRNESFDQEWARGTGRLPYKRNEVRITFEIPEDDRRLIPWKGRGELLTPLVAKDLSAFGDPENWFVYDGRVSPELITEVKEVCK